MDIREQIGMLGEQVVAEQFPYAVKSEYKYDSEKDGMIGPHKYEVKTTTFIAKTQSLWVQENQWLKLDNVDYIFFITAPHKKYDYFRKDKLCQLFMSIDNRYRILNHDRERVRSYELKHLTPICDVKKEISDEIISLTNQLTRG
jgi:hypothetical protein